MKNYISKKSIHIICEGEWDKSFIDIILRDIYNNENIFLHLHPKIDEVFGKKSIEKNLKKLQDINGIDNIYYYIVYDTDNQKEKLLNKEYINTQEIRINKCLEFMILSIIDDEYHNKHKDNLEIKSEDIKKYFKEKYKIKSKEDFCIFLKENLNKELLERKRKEIEELDKIIKIFK